VSKKTEAPEKIMKRTMKAAFLLTFLGCIQAYAQDPGTWAAQQANQQAMQDAQQANQQATQNAQQAMQDAQSNVSVVAVTRQPTFSVKPGAVAPGTTVRIKSPTHYAVIYYTTNGWTPTIKSRRYVGSYHDQHYDGTAGHCHSAKHGS
jgi:hypothetical protein